MDVPVFSGEGFDIWSVQMMVLLMFHNLWENIENGFEDKEALASEKEEYIRNEVRALNLIRQGLSDNILPMVKNATTAKAAWDILQEEFLYNSKVFRCISWFRKDNSTVPGKRKEESSDCLFPPELLDFWSKLEISRVHGKEQVEVILEDEVEGSYLSAPPFYELILSESHISPNYYLSFPSRLNDQLPKKNLQAFVRCKGKTWELSYIVKMNLRRFSIASWKKFVDGNNLRIGDALVFELIESSETELEFTILILPKDIPLELLEMEEKRRAEAQHRQFSIK